MIDLSHSPVTARPDMQVDLPVLGAARPATGLDILDRNLHLERQRIEARFVAPLVAAFAAVVLAGCGTTGGKVPEPVVVPVETKVPVAVSCVPKNFKDEPEYVDSDAALKAAPGAEDRYQLVWTGRLQRDAYLTIVRPVLKGCKD